MMTGNVHSAKFPALSVALHVTEVEVETLKRVAPESGHDKDLMPDSSRATTLVTKPTVTSGRASVAIVAYVMFLGQEENVGGLESVTLTKKTQREVRPELSVAELIRVEHENKIEKIQTNQVTLVTPRLKM
jgi:hypothetical protein